jgi:N-acetylneuraminic acid mutarotase
MKFLRVGSALALCLFVSCKKNVIPGKGTPPGDLSPEIVSFSPETGSPGIPVEITGMHFDSVAANLIVSFNGVPGKIYWTTDSDLAVFVPQGAISGKISITKGGNRAFSSDNFTILTGGSWVQKQSMPARDSANGRIEGIGFSIGNKGYMGLGMGNDLTVYSDLNEYDPSTGTWTPKSSLSIPLSWPVCMVINNIAYVGIGNIQGFGNSNGNTNAFFAYDPVADTWARKADFPGVLRFGALGMAVGNKGFVGFGYGSTGALRDFWSYDPATDSWIQKADFPGVLIPEDPLGFTLDNQTAYIGGYVSEYDEGVNLWYQYDPVADIWTTKNPRPGTNPLGINSALVINGTGYVMGGGVENWMYQPASDSWTQVPFFGQRSGGSTFVIGNSGYYGLGSGIPGNDHVDLWQFTP